MLPLVAKKIKHRKTAKKEQIFITTLVGRLEIGENPGLDSGMSMPHCRL
jgi:hypothetical protein